MITTTSLWLLAFLRTLRTIPQAGIFDNMTLESVNFGEKRSANDAESNYNSDEEGEEDEEVHAQSPETNLFGVVCPPTSDGNLK
jgi:hypothetical protein